MKSCMWTVKLDDMDATLALGRRWVALVSKPALARWLAIWEPARPPSLRGSASGSNSLLRSSALRSS